VNQGNSLDADQNERWSEDLTVTSDIPDSALNFKGIFMDRVFRWSRWPWVARADGRSWLFLNAGASSTRYAPATRLRLMSAIELQSAINIALPSEP
jgi:hypothetical protein